MTARRFLLFAALLLVVSSLVTTAGIQDRRDAPSKPLTVSEPPTASAAAVAVAHMPRRRALRARVGDVVRITVRSRFSDTVVVPALAIETPVDLRAPALLTFVADRRGRFTVRLRDARDAIGTIVIR